MTDRTRYYWDPDYTRAYPAQTLAYVDAALLTCSICESIGSLGSEVKHIWKGPRNASQIFHLSARYMCILSFIVFLASDDPRLNALNSGYFYTVQGYTHWFFNINLVFVELIFLRRTWALWDRKRKVAIWLSVLSGLSWGTTAGLIVLGMLMLGGNFTFLYFVPLTFFYFVILVMVAVRTVELRSTMSTSLIRLVYAQGVIWYAGLLILSIIGLVNVIIDPLQITIISRLIQFIFVHMACRMTLGLKEHREKGPAGMGIEKYLWPVFPAQHHGTFEGSSQDTAASSEPKLVPLRRPVSLV